jgi:hypothetical protein
MRRLLLLLATSLPILHATAQDGLWSPVSKSVIQPYLNGRSAVSATPVHYELVKLNRSKMQQLQLQAPLVKPGVVSSISPVRVTLPLPASGKSLSSAFTESPILSDALAKQLTGFKTYELKDPVTHSIQGRLTVTTQGVSGFIFSENGSAYIHPVSPEYPDVHMVYYVKDIPFTLPLQCNVKEELTQNSNSRVQSVLAGDCQLRNYRLAVAATGEYTAWAGGTQAQALTYIGIMVNDVTAIYERDAGITFTLVSDNSIIFTDATTDLYPTETFPSGSTLALNHTALNNGLTNSGYDEGIVVNNGWNGGLASLGVVCNNSFKGRGAAGLTFGTGANPTPGPQGPIFVNTVAHEMAHQFNVTHTMSATNGGCGGNVTASTAYEPGGGSTIMAYAGTCSGNSYQNYSDLYFHGGSILQMMTFAMNNATCRTPTAMTNAAPTVSVPATSYTIPVSTPFMLTATGADANANTLYYNWEQMDANVTTAAPPSATATGGPNFRSYPLSTSSTRVFPRLADIVSGAATTYEVLPSVTRTMNFQVMVRDAASGGGCTANTTVAVNTNNAAGPFTVTSQNTTSTWTANGSNTATITWNVAGSNAAPVNCSNVDIILSTDGGVTFTDTLLANTANDGTENITIPSLPTNIGRVMVKARNNIFFNINTANITITSSCSANGTTFSPSTAVVGVAGDAALDLSLSPVYGSIVTISGTLANTDPTANLTVVDDGTSSCAQFGNVFQYDTYRFTPSVSGSYTFTRSGGTGTQVFNLYSDNFVPGSPCTNFINSSGRYNGSVSFAGSYSATLTAGLYYTMAVGTFASGNPALPSAYTINVTGPGSLYSNTPNPGAGFNYTYVIVNNATGLIRAFDASSNLSNSTTYPVGTSYTIYGLSYSNAISLATLNTYIGTSFTSFRNAILYNPASLCGSVSANNALVTVTATLPFSANMLSLTAAKAGKVTNLKWSAASSKISHFEIWRSANNSDFNELIGTVQAQDNGGAFTEYALNDNMPLTTWNYYRLKQMDKDGSSTLSNIASVNMHQSQSALSVYPNPVKSSFTLSYNAPKVETVSVRIFNSKGSLVYQNSLSAQTGENQYTIPAAVLPKGIYVVQVVSSGDSYTARFVKE